MLLNRSDAVVLGQPEFQLFAEGAGHLFDGGEFRILCAVLESGDGGPFCMRQRRKLLLRQARLLARLPQQNADLEIPVPLFEFLDKVGILFLPLPDGALQVALPFARHHSSLPQRSRRSGTSTPLGP